MLQNFKILFLIKSEFISEFGRVNIIVVLFNLFNVNNKFSKNNFNEISSSINELIVIKKLYLLNLILSFFLILLYLKKSFY